jgi:hypothetical protein
MNILIDNFSKSLPSSVLGPNELDLLRAGTDDSNVAVVGLSSGNQI